MMTDYNALSFLKGPSILVPITIDIVHLGSHVFDSFTWDINQQYPSVEEFSVQTCLDLVSNFVHKACIIPW